MWTDRRSCPNPSPPPVVLTELEQRLAPGSAPRADVARCRLVLADMDVPVERDREQLVGRVAGDESHRTPVVWSADQVHRPALDPKRLDPIGHQHTSLDGGTRGNDRGPATVLEPALGRERG